MYRSYPDRGHILPSIAPMLSKNNLMLTLQFASNFVWRVLSKLIQIRSSKIVRNRFGTLAKDSEKLFTLSIRLSCFKTIQVPDSPHFCPNPLSPGSGTYYRRSGMVVLLQLASLTSSISLFLLSCQFRAIGYLNRQVLRYLYGQVLIISCAFCQYPRHTSKH